MFKILKPYTNLVYLFSEKKDGSMKVNDNPINIENRHNFFVKNNIDPNRVVGKSLKHTSNVLILNEPIIPKEDYDGWITNKKELYLSITSADCPTIFFYDPKNIVIGLAHGGWRGIAGDIIKNTLIKLKEDFNSNPQDILVVIGPGMCQDCYEVDKIFSDNFKKYPSAFKEVGDKLHFNLNYVINQKLLSEGIEAKNIEFSNECSYCLKDKYFSYRRDQYGCDNNDVQAMVGVFGIKE